MTRLYLDELYGFEQDCDFHSEKRYGEKVFQTKIRENIAIAEMPLSGQTIFEYDPKSNGATDYRTLTDEIISREENR